MKKESALLSKRNIKLMEIKKDLQNLSISTLKHLKLDIELELESRESALRFQRENIQRGNNL